MATVNLGSIKFNWQGAYAGGTAYAVDDVVSYNGTSYVCILASTGNLPTNATYWNVMAQAGTNGTDGTDLTTTLSTQGDIVYRDASGLQRLGAGTSGQALLTGGAGANPSWGTVSAGKVLQYVNTHINGTYSSNSNTYANFSGLPTFTITPSSTSSKILIMSTWQMATSNWNILKFVRSIGGTSYGDFLLSTGGTGNHIGSHFSGAKQNDSDANMTQSVTCNLLDSPNTTSQVAYKLQAATWNPNIIYINRTVDFNNAYFPTGTRVSNVMLMELEG